MTDSSSMPFPVVKVQEPRIDVQPRVYYANMGGANVTQQVVKATTTTNNQIVFSATTPSPNVFLSRRMYIEYQLQFNFERQKAGDVATANNAVTYGLRAFPLSACTETLTLKLNNSTITTNLRDVIHAMQHFGSSPEERNRWMSGIPSIQDQFQQYGQMAADDQAGARNVFSRWASNNVEQSRLSGLWGTFDAGTRQIYSTFELYEPIFAPCLNWSDQEVPGFVGVTSFQLIFTLGNLGRAWSDAVLPAGNARITAASFPANYSASLHIEYITPQITVPPPIHTFYPYYELGRYVKSSQTIANGAVSAPQSTDTLSFSSIPKRIYVYARVPLAPTIDAIANQTDTFAEIQKINVTWNNQAGILSSASPKDLHDMSVRAGSDQSWIQFRYYQGAVLCIRPGIDIPLGALEANGSRGTYQFRAELTLKNNTGADTPFDMIVVPVLEGFLEIDNQVVKQHIGELTQQIINDSKFAPPGTLAFTKNMFGGAWYNDLWDVIKKPLNIVSKIGEAAAPALSAIPGYGAVVSPIVSGVSGTMRRLTGGKGRRARSKSGSRPRRRGGRKISRSCLKARIA